MPSSGGVPQSDRPHYRLGATRALSLSVFRPHGGQFCAGHFSSKAQGPDPGSGVCGWVPAFKAMLPTDGSRGKHPEVWYLIFAGPLV